MELHRDRDSFLLHLRESEGDGSMLALATTDVIPLAEAMASPLDKDGKFLVKIIRPGWGSSGYYGADVLEEAGRNGVFKEGTHMYWDHPSISEAMERPERSLRDLAAVFLENARWDPNGPKGPGLYTKAKAFPSYREALREMAPHIGPSIRAFGNAHFGEMEGRSGPIVESIVAAQSVDFVTQPGAGGEVMQLFEAAGRRAATAAQPQDNRENDAVELQEALRQLNDANVAKAAAEASVTSLTEANATLTRERDEARAETRRLQEAGVLREARDVVADAITKVPQRLPEITKTRLIEQVAFNPPVDDKGALDKSKLGERLTEAVKSEVAYLNTVLGGGTISGNNSLSEGAGDAGDTGELTALTEVMGGFGLPEDGVKIAINGR